MELIETEAKPLMMTPAEEPEEPAETEPPKAERNTEPGGPNWPLWALVLLIAAGLIVGLVFLARWIYHLAHNTSATKNPTTTQTQNKTGKGGLSVNSGGSNNGGGINVSGGNNSKNSGNKSTAGTGTTLPNNGPGNVIGMFAAASFAAGSLHYIISLRKAAREN